MIEINEIKNLPSVPAVYALLGGSDSRSYVAYVGIGGKLKSRIVQHLVRKDSSVTTGTTATSLNPEHVTQVRWWEAKEFTDEDSLHAAEVVAIRVLDPALRSRGSVRSKALELLADPLFDRTYSALFEGEPTGVLHVPSLTGALERIAQLEQRICSLEKGT
jgi:hypothetical protein